MSENLYLTPAEKYTAALAGLYEGDLPLATTAYTKLINCILNNDLENAEYSDELTRFIYSYYVSDLQDSYPMNNICKLIYWKLHDITPVQNGIRLEVTIDEFEDSVPITNDLIKIWAIILYGEEPDFFILRDVDGYCLKDSDGYILRVRR